MPRNSNKKNKPAGRAKSPRPARDAASSDAPATGSIVLCGLPHHVGRWRVESVDGKTVRIAQRQRGLVVDVPRASLTLCES